MLFFPTKYLLQLFVCIIREKSCSSQEYEQLFKVFVFNQSLSNKIIYIFKILFLDEFVYTEKRKFMVVANVTLS